MNRYQKRHAIFKICSFFKKFLKIDVYHTLINLEIFIKILIVWIFWILQMNVVQSSFEIWWFFITMCEIRTEYMRLNSFNLTWDGSAILYLMWHLVTAHWWRQNVLASTICANLRTLCGTSLTHTFITVSRTRTGCRSADQRG